MIKKYNNLDSRAMRGILLRGKNIYPDGSPNPVGKNQHTGNKFAEAARKRIRGNSSK